MAKRIIRGKFLFPVFLSLSILFIDIAFHSSEIHAEDTETTPPIATTFRSKEKHTRDMKVALEEEISTEAIWFGFDEEVAIATRH